MTVNWTSDQLALAFELYARTPFGRLHQHNPDVIELATLIGRTPSAVAMKCCNFASLDPTHQARGIKGLGNASAADQDTFARYAHDLGRLAEDVVEAAKRVAVDGGLPDDLAEFDMPDGPTVVEATVKVRRGQVAFRRAVLAAYEDQCAVCHLNLPTLLWAGHIIPWAKLEEKRLDPTNGICFCVLHERAFDRGYFTVDEQMKIATSPVVACDEPPAVYKAALLDIDGADLTRPHRFAPAEAALAYHREHVFQAA